VSASGWESVSVLAWVLVSELALVSVLVLVLVWAWASESL
jgi:hypothetical protein